MIKKITPEEYRHGVESGNYFHVYDTSDKKIKVIQRDGYYSPETMKNFVNVDEFSKSKISEHGWPEK
jgi:hypothetical protein